ncbi:MATE family efflux transporter [Helicobacter sp. MIT 21-1697]|uniref:MATE family efflux transporter n=1 Tax=Helicobacter sp. MIT 21-1697 TaxID=2993733 RepID=UPI00224ACFC4|nr:MATE family efflux transporter [Helicobacter sp. MIT 21-1697]MCX2716545.1 MATE family efflux transporter [Helicobacter sp. MIT 21-1697]
MIYNFKQRLHKILSIALPSGGNSLLDIANIAIGMYFIAHISPDSEVTKHNIVALGLGMSCWMFLFALTTIFYVGTNAQVSRAFGERNNLKTGQILSTMSIGAGLCSIPIYALAYMSNEFYFNWMGVGGETKELGMLYLNWIFYGIPALFLKTIFISALSAIGDTKSVFFVKIIATSLNIILNFMLIFGVQGLGIPPFGIMGAGIANVIITYFECLILLGILCGLHHHLTFLPTFKWQILYNGLCIGIPSGIERGLTIFSLVLITKFMTDYGLEVIAGFQIGSRVESFIFMPGFGFQVAAMALVGQMLGARRLDLAESFIKTILLISSVVMGILGIGLCVLGKELSAIFSTEVAVIEYSFDYLLAVGLSQVPLICIFVLDGALRGSGATKLSLWINTGSIWILRILPMWLCVHYDIAVGYIFAIICCETYLRAGIFGFVFYKGLWKKYIAQL